MGRQYKRYGFIREFIPSRCINAANFQGGTRRRVRWLLLMHRCNIGDTLIQGEWGYISGRPHNFLAASTPSPIPCLPYLLTSVSLDMCTHFERFLGFKRVSEFGNLYLVEFSKDRSIILLLSLRFSLFPSAIPSRYFLCLRLNIDSCRVEYLSQS